ncbi:hypothetical protein P7D22_04715 [Lichenihabitans sp. Uapishka_5]|uniref:hypothetical protein n=1 Tax=Lichenihabitans sp. Uapishka_5 TaxID=3037302 RepID=UPI0029E827CB|nr:hypothetical protein [Lichenihabitans sp. Uapishka_5]MDX7950481.1 hypothetical protein [Lichenihabitans sp. Uapishka_5]
MISSEANRAHALARMNAAARRAPTPAMTAKAAAIGRKLDAVRKGLPRSLPPGTIVLSGSARLSRAEFERLRDEGRRMATSAFHHFPTSLEA